LIVLKDVSLSLSVEEALTIGGLSRIADKIDNLGDLLDECVGLIRPAALYNYLKIERVIQEGVLVEDGKLLSSPRLAEELKCATEIAPYILTIGPDLERRVTETSHSRLLDSWILDNLGTYALRLLTRHLEERIKAEKGWEISRFSPGSTPSWELDQQEVIFSMFSKEKVQEAIGVCLTDQFVMIPKKSVSGIMGQTETVYHNCQECQKMCEYRQVPYREESPRKLPASVV